MGSKISCPPFTYQVSIRIHWQIQQKSRPKTRAGPCLHHLRVIHVKGVGGFIAAVLILSCFPVFFEVIKEALKEGDLLWWAPVAMSCKNRTNTKKGALGGD